MPPKRKLVTKPTSSAKAPMKKLKQTTLFSATSVALPTPPNTSPPHSTSVSPVPPATAVTEPLTVTPDDYDEHVVNRKFYPPLISNASCAAYQSGEKPTPFKKLQQALSSTAGFRTRINPGRTAVHWFRTDLRIHDNTGLSLAGKYAEFVRKDDPAKEDFALIALFVISPEDLEAHIMSPARMDFAMRSLEVLKTDLEEKNIPLVVETVEKRKDVVKRVLMLCDTWGANHIWANAEYEVDELRRDEELIREGEKNGVAVNILHDTCVVPPETLTTKSDDFQSSGNPYSVYTPWYKSWLAYLRDNPSLLDISPPPPPNPSSALTLHAPLFSIPLPPNPIPPTPSELSVLHTLYPAGSHAASARLSEFLSKTGSNYHTTRNTPSIPGTSLLSPHFTSGTLSTRTAISAAYILNKNSLSTSSPSGYSTWISELAWRDFYRHILAAFPWVCMNKPFKPEFASITWCPSPVADQRFEAWKAGHTGYPLVDAAMRHLSTEKFMPNRLRMVVASFLCKDLHVDWRRGEQYFMSELVDADFASNNGGWGWSSSAGADPQPYFRIFNPESQLKTFDPEGVYVRRWVEELRGVSGAEMVKGLTEGRRRALGYGMRVVEHDKQRKEAVEIYKLGIERGKMVGDEDVRR